MLKQAAKPSKAKPTKMLWVGVGMVGLSAVGLSGCQTTSEQVAPWLGVGAQVASAAGYGQQAQTVQGVRQILLLSHERASQELMRSGAVGLRLPQSAQNTIQVLRQLGFASQIDRLELSLNRSAEQAIRQAAPVFQQAIRNMNVNDAVGIVAGGQTAATQYFRTQTEETLRRQYQPIVQEQLRSTGFYDHYQAYQTAINQLPAAQRQSLDLERYVIDQSLDQLFRTMGREEAKIRSNPIEYGSQVIGIIFGAPSR